VDLLLRKEESIAPAKKGSGGGEAEEDKRNIGKEAFHTLKSTDHIQKEDKFNRR